MKELVTKDLDSKTIQTILNNFESCFYNNSVFVIYENHIPQACFFLKSGKIEIYKKKELVYTLSPYEIIGLIELKNDIPSKFGVKIIKGSEVCIIGKYSLNNNFTDFLKSS